MRKALTSFLYLTALLSIPATSAQAWGDRYENGYGYGHGYVYGYADGYRYAPAYGYGRGPGLSYGYAPAYAYRQGPSYGYGYGPAYYGGGGYSTEGPGPRFYSWRDRYSRFQDGFEPRYRRR